MNRLLRKTKPFLAAVLVIIMAVGMVPNFGLLGIRAEAAERAGDPVKSEANWKYYDDGELVITGDIPDYTEANPAPWHAYAANVKTITIAEGVTKIGDYAFYEFTGTAKIYVPASVTSVSKDAFKGFALTYGAYGGSYEDFNTIFPPTGVAFQVNHVHTAGDVRHTKTADCKNDGYTGDTYCAKCGAFYLAGEKILSTTVPHTWSTDKKVKVEATCQHEGQKGRYCIKCGAFDDESLETIKKTGHKWEFDGNKIADCKTANSAVVYKCTNEGCTATKTQAVTDHTYLYKVIDPTCTDEGYTAVTCKFCSAVDEKTDKKPALGHNADRLVIVKERTCEDEGEYHQVCSRCNTVDTVTKLPPLGHDYSVEVITKDPTCPTADSTGMGTKELRCSRCEAVKETTEIPNLHTKGSWEATKYVGIEADCVNNGVYYFKCKICGRDICEEDAEGKLGTKRITEEIPKTPNSHKSSRWITLTKPTCEETGLMVKKCTTSGCPYHSDSDIGKAIDKASDDTVVKALIGSVDNALADKIADYILKQYYNLADPKGSAIADIIKANATEKKIMEVFDTDQNALAEEIMKAAGEEIAKLAIEDPAASVTAQLITDDLSKAFEKIGDKWVEDAVSAASENDIKLIANVTLDSQVIAATGHDYQTVSYYRDIKDGKDVYVPVGTENGTDYYPVTELKKVEADGSVTYEPVLDKSGSPIDQSAYPIVTNVDCNEGGTLVKMCAKCGSISSTNVPKGSHKYVVQVIEPTCTKQGYTLQTCEFCTYSKTYNYTPSLNHNWQTVVIKESTCTRTGLQAKKCANCEEIDKTTYQPLATAPHDYTMTVVDPTCTVDGYTQHTCKVCGGGYRDNPVKSNGHSFVDVVTKATCTVDGYTTHTCSVCDYEYKDDFVIAVGHQYGPEKEIAATCTTDAYTQQICTVCDAEKKTNVQPGTRLGHLPVDDPSVDPTCTEDGLTAGIHCDRCDVILVPQEILHATGHKPVTISEQPATCTEDGHTAGKYCSVCGDILEGYETLTALGHDWITTPYQAPTCTEDGHTAGKFCNKCGLVVETPSPLPASGHKFDDGVVVKKATAFSNGIMLYTCTVCGHTEQQSFKPTFVQRIAWLLRFIILFPLIIIGVVEM